MKTDASNPAALIDLSGPAPEVRAALHQSDYDKVRRSLEFISQNWQVQPDLALIAEHVGLSETHLTALFRRWAGLTPKAFLQAVTLDHARRMLKSASVLDTALEAGLSGPGRLHDLFVTHEALSPGEWKKNGAGLTFSYGFHPSPFGEALIVASPRGMIAMGWVDETSTAAGAAFDGKHGHGRAGALQDMVRRWPAAHFQENAELTRPYALRAFEPELWQAGRPLRLVLIGSDFEIRVWQALLSVPFGGATTYSDLAQAIGNPKAARAVGAAVGRNPLSFVVPCHRVLGKSGALTGYHWGVIRKQAILGWEAGHLV
eukprot:gene2554-2593_t